MFDRSDKENISEDEKQDLEEAEHHHVDQDKDEGLSEEVCQHLQISV